MADQIDKTLIRRLRQAGQRAIRARSNLEAASAVRDQLIVEASEAGMTRRAVAELAGVTVGRVQQILDEQRP